jgi:anti-sigma-K factor RskA
MNYNQPELGERLAADYVLGTMPPRARRRFETVMSGNATLCASVAAWSDRLSPLDSLTADEAPRAHVWRAIKQRIESASPASPQWRTWIGPLTFWRGFAMLAGTAVAMIALYIVINPAPSRDIAQALSEKVGLPDLIASAQHSQTHIGLSTISLGGPERERPRWMRAALLVTGDALPLTGEAGPPRR